MEKQRNGLSGTWVAMGVVAAGMFAWRFMCRQRVSHPVPVGDLSRWEGEGGASAGIGQDAPVQQVQSQAAATQAGPMPAQANGAAGAAWPFPHS